MLGILWKDLKVMRMQTAILTSIFLMMTVASVWNTGRQDDISFFLNFSTLMPIFFTLLPCSALALEQQEQTNAWLMTLPCSENKWCWRNMYCCWCLAWVQRQFLGLSQRF